MLREVGGDKDATGPEHAFLKAKLCARTTTALHGLSRLLSANTTFCSVRRRTGRTHKQTFSSLLGEALAAQYISQTALPQLANWDRANQERIGLRKLRFREYLDMQEVLVGAQRRVHAGNTILLCDPFRRRWNALGSAKSTGILRTYCPQLRLVINVLAYQKS